ncbi:MAG: InlB B-repeat-containing protein [Treponema sp.]
MHIHRTTNLLSRLAGALLLAAFAISCKPNIDTPKTVKEITLTFNLAGGAINGKTDSVTVKGKYEEAVTKPDAPEKDGYMFSGWNPELPETFPAENATYTAQWAKLYLVTFTVEGTPPNGTLTATLDGKAIDTGAMVAEGKIVEFTAKDDEYAVENWVVTPMDALIEGGKPGESTAKVKITAATTVKVTFSYYKKVAFTDLDTYLKTQHASSDGIYYIEVTDLVASNVKGVDWHNPSPLGKILRDNASKKVALKLGAIADLTDMSHCFSECKNLTQAPVIPNGVTSMSFCFVGCTKLTQAPVIPDKVTHMNACFFSCTKLTSVTLKCNYPSSAADADAFKDAFGDCDSLMSNSIKVPAGQLSAYQGGASNMGTTADRFFE